MSSVEMREDQDDQGKSGRGGVVGLQGGEVSIGLGQKTVKNTHTLNLPCFVHVATLLLMLSLVEKVEDGWWMKVKPSLPSFR